MPHVAFPSGYAFCNFAFNFLFGAGFGVVAPAHKLAVGVTVKKDFFSESAFVESSTSFAENEVGYSQFAASFKVGEFFGSAYGSVEVAAK